MDNRDFSNIGEQIRDSVEKAIDSMDFGQLNRAISDTVSGALDEVRRQVLKGTGGLGSGGDYNRETVYRECTVRDIPPEKETAPGRGTSPGREAAPGWGTPPRREVPPERKPPVIIKSRFSGRVAGVLYTVFGGVGAGITGILLFTALVIAVFSTEPWNGMAGLIGLTAALALASGFLMKKGSTLRGRIKRLKMYLAAAGDRAYCSIEDLALRLGKSRKFVIKDLQKMIRCGMLPEAYIDEQQTHLMLNWETYQQYLNLQKTQKQREAEEKAARTAEKKTTVQEPEQSQPTPLEEAINTGKAYLQTLKKANEAIPGEVISAKLSRLESIISRIFESVEAHPEQLGEIEKFMDYYLPTTVKLVEAYRDFDSVPVQGENISTAKGEIEQTLDTINQAFERLLDDLYQAAAFDASTDASVLQAMLKKDGWMESDFSRRTGE